MILCYCCTVSLCVKDPKQIEGMRQVVKTQQFIGLFVCQIADIELDL